MTDDMKQWKVQRALDLAENSIRTARAVTVLVKSGDMDGAAGAADAGRLRALVIARRLPPASTIRPVLGTIDRTPAHD
jgi:ribosomal protein S9